jgi:hypothetical protein
MMICCCLLSFNLHSQTSDTLKKYSDIIKKHIYSDYKGMFRSRKELLSILLLHQGVINMQMIYGIGIRGGAMWPYGKYYQIKDQRKIKMKR